MSEGKPLLNHVIDALQPQVDTLVMCGRKWPELACLAERPELDPGPLGGLCAALQHDRENDFQAVVTAGSDTLPVPPNLAHLLQYPAAVIRNPPLFGFWPASMADRKRTRKNPVT